MVPTPSTSSTNAASDLPSFSTMARLHSRSSSQIATLASLTLSPSFLPASSSVPPSPTRNGARSPRFSVSGLGGYDSPPFSLDPGASGGDGSRSTSPESWALGSGTISPVRKGSAGNVFEGTVEVDEPLELGLAALADTPEGTSGLAQLIQKKRRQASAPYLASARSSSLFSPGAGFGISSTTETGATTPPFAAEDMRRARSRQASRAGTVGSLQLGGLWERDGTGMVMTPTTEEWRQLGGQLSELADIRARDEARLALTTGMVARLSMTPSTASSSSSSSIAPLDATPPESASMSLRRETPLRHAPVTRPTSSSSSSSSSSRSGSPQPFGTPMQPRPSRPSFSYNSPKPTHSTSSSHDYTITTPSTDPSSAPRFKPTHRSLLSDSALRPNLTRGSLSTSNTGTPTSPSQRGSSRSLEPVDISPPPVRPVSPVALGRTTGLGPVDPRKYSAVTGLRGIDAFVIEGEAGKGAYGTVRKAREKGTDGLAFGPELIIKYVIKQRILADCWKKHKILGPIPIEVHVLDHLRRVPYAPRSKTVAGRRRVGGGTARRDSATTDGEATTTGHPNICGMLDFFEDGEYYYLVMPQAGADPTMPSAPGGQDLFDYVDLHPTGLPLSSIRRILTQIAEAIYFLHDHGIVHRDIKDENIVLDHKGNVQVIDFGSAAYVKEGKKFDTFSGTLDFAAPEVLRGARYGGKETDIWALGVLGYVIICGECPFWNPEEAILGLYPGSRTSLALLAKCPSSTSSSPLSSPASDEGPDEGGTISNAVDLVMRCLQVDPADRPTADQVLDHKFVVGRQGWEGFRGWEVEDID